MYMITESSYDLFLSALTAEIKNNWYKKTGQLALKIGITQGHLSKIVNKKVQAREDTQLKIANFFKHKSVESFIQSVNNPEEKNNHCFEVSSTEDWELLKSIYQFKNRDFAIKLNHKLVQIESLDSGFRALSEISIFVDDKLRAIRKKKEGSAPKKALG